MKTALCLYGHFRSFDNCWPGLQEYLIKPNHITDIFTMAWVDSVGHFKHPAGRDKFTRKLQVHLRGIITTN